MSDDKVPEESAELTELDPLPELPDDGSLEELPEMPDLPMEPLPDAPPARAGGSDGPPPLRVLDKAPAHLRTASIIVVCGSILPWMAHGAGLVTSLLAKLLALLGVWFWFQQVQHNWGPKLKGVLGSLASMGAKEEEEEKPARRSRVQSDAPTTLKHPFPTGLHIASLVVIAISCIVLPLVDPSMTDQMKRFTAMAEVGMLAWAAFTYVHIHAYERWGHFNPLFPLMFLAMMFGGALTAFSALGNLGGGQGLASLAGGGAVAAGGVMAAFTIVEAMIAAKKEGDAKRQATLEARKAARESRRR